MGDQTVEKAWKIKATSTEIFGKASFKLHKWNSNVRELEAFGAHDNEGVVTYAKEQLGVKPGECGLLGLRWNKDSNNDNNNNNNNNNNNTLYSKRVARNSYRN